MVRNPSVDKNGMKKGAWSEEEDHILRTYIEKHGHSNWRQLPKVAGIARCGKSCRLRWLNYLKPGLKKGIYSKEEDELIIKLRQQLGNKWSIIASKLPGRTDNEIKNHWHTHLKKGKKQADKKPCVSRQKTSEKNHLPDQNKNHSIIITDSNNDQEIINDIDDNSFLELYDILVNEPFSIDELNTMISPSAGSCNSTVSFTEPSGSFLNEPFSLEYVTNSLISPSAGSCNSTISVTEPSGSFLNEFFSFDATNSLISPSAGSCNSTISYTEPSGSFLNEPFSLEYVTNSLISPSSSCNATIPIDATATGESWEEPLLIEASNNQVFHTNFEESINAGSGWTEPSWLSTFYQVLSSSSSSSKNEGFNLPFSVSDGYDLFN